MRPHFCSVSLRQKDTGAIHLGLRNLFVVVQQKCTFFHADSVHTLRGTSHEMNAVSTLYDFDFLCLAIVLIDDFLP